MSNPSDILIDVEDVSYDYESNDQVFPVLKNVSFKIKRGEMLAIQGSSGSGKSTLLYLLGLMMPIKHGKIFFDQLTPSELNDDRRAKIRNTRIGFVFQQFHLLPRTSVLDNILLPLSYQNSEVSPGDKQRAKLLASQLGITELLTKHPNHLSGGQQQRVAICRALINNAELILADEPTGNLDPTNATQILDIFRRLSHDEGKTIVIITHDQQIAQKCDRILSLANGKLLESPTDKVHSRPRPLTLKVLEEKRNFSSSLQKFWQTFMEHIPLSIANIQRNRLRSWLTMIGVSVGIASVLAMMTLGGFARDQILEQFFENGANTFDIRTFFSSSQKASDRNLQTFQGIDAAIEIPTLKNILPDIQSISPVRTIWNARVSSVGTKSDSMESDVGIKGSDPSLLQTGLLRLDEGRFLIDDDLKYARPVCVVGQKIAQQLLLPVNRIGQFLTINTNRDSFICKVIGIFSKSSKQIVNSSLDTVILMPESFVAIKQPASWERPLFDLVITGKRDADMSRLANSIQNYFKIKFGSSIQIWGKENVEMQNQMKNTLAIFQILLISISIITLFVGGMGLTNLMLASVNERFREIGVRKAVGASDGSILMLFLSETVFLCLISGAIGVVLGLTVFHALLWFGSEFTHKLTFTWIIDWSALILSVVATLCVGVISGVFPAVKAQRLSVIEALRTD